MAIDLSNINESSVDDVNHERRHERGLKLNSIKGIARKSEFSF